MKHIERLLTKDEILEIEKQYSFLQQELAKDGLIGFKTQQDHGVVMVVEQNLINKVPHLIAHIKELQSINDGLRESDHKLSCLEAAGVDNWEGYDYAMELMREKGE
jgi:hypothetical protein